MPVLRIWVHISALAFYNFVNVLGVSASEWTTVPLQGSGTFSVEAVIQTAVPRKTSKKVPFNSVL